MATHPNEMVLSQIIPPGLHGSPQFATIVNQWIEKHLDQFVGVLSALPVVEDEETRATGGVPGVTGLSMNPNPIIEWIMSDERTPREANRLGTVRMMLTLLQQQVAMLKTVIIVPCGICGAPVHVSGEAMRRAQEVATSRGLEHPHTFCMVDTAVLRELTSSLTGTSGVVVGRQV